MLTRLAAKICAQSARLWGCHFQIVEQAAAAAVQRRTEATTASWNGNGNGTEAQGPRGPRRTTVGRGEPVKGPLQWRCSWSIMVMLRRGAVVVQKVTTKAEGRWRAEMGEGRFGIGASKLEIRLSGGAGRRGGMREAM